MNKAIRPRTLQALLALALLLPFATQARLVIDITGGTEAALPIAVVPFAREGNTQQVPESVSRIISQNLQRSGKFEPLPERDLIARPSQQSEVRYQQWRALGVDNLIIGGIRQVEPGLFELRFEVLDVYGGGRIIGKRYRVQEAALRTLAHNISDLIYEALTGVPGAFSTQIVYVAVEQREDGRTHKLILADADGERPQTILTSQQPLMSPAWSPDRKHIAYVSFEGENRSAVFIQEVATGERRKVAAFQGINSAPAWSPDGRRLALTLSKDGNPDIYVLDVASEQVRRLTNSSSIDTEPAWTPDGRSIVFTSDRGGRPQIYRMSANGGSASRLTFEGSYNARPNLSPDGKRLAMVHRDDRGFRIAVMDLESKELRLLTRGPQDESPSFAANGDMIIYSRSRGGRGQLATVSVHGLADGALPITQTRVQDPAWSPR